MVKVESCIVCKLQPKKTMLLLLTTLTETIILWMTASSDDDDDNDDDDDDDDDDDGGITITCAYSTSIKGLLSISPYLVTPSERCILNTFKVWLLAKLLRSAQLSDKSIIPESNRIKSHELSCIQIFQHFYGKSFQDYPGW